MRFAVMSDIHGNLLALEAVLADVRSASPDLIIQGGDLAGPGSKACEVLDRIRARGYPSVMGNTDEMLTNPESLTRFAAQSKAPQSMWAAISDMAEWMQNLLGDSRLEWLKRLPLAEIHAPMVVVHASPKDCWRAPTSESSDEALITTFKPLGQPLVVYGHTHVPFVRKAPGITVVNSGSVGQPLDGDKRAAYVLIDEKGPVIRRVEYDVDREVSAVRMSGLPHAEWLAKILQTARPQMP